MEEIKSVEIFMDAGPLLKWLCTKFEGGGIVSGGLGSIWGTYRGVFARYFEVRSMAVRYPTFTLRFRHQSNLGGSSRKDPSSQSRRSLLVLQDGLRRRANLKAWRFLMCWQTEAKEKRRRKDNQREEQKYRTGPCFSFPRAVERSMVSRDSW